jgi:hypothetical protein
MAKAMKMRKIDVWWLTAQTFAIVGSILLAFGIEAWWSDRQEDEEVSRLVASLEVETVANIAEIVRMRKYRSAVSLVCTKILSASPENLSLEQFDEYLADLLWWRYAEFSLGALTSIIDGRSLAALDDPGLGLQISLVNELLQDVRRGEDEDHKVTRDELTLFIYNNGSFPQVSNAASGRGEPGIGNWEPAPVVADEGGRDHRSFLVDDRFRGIVVLKQWAQADSLTSHRRLEASMRELLAVLADH